MGLKVVRKSSLFFNHKFLWLQILQKEMDTEMVQFVNELSLSIPMDTGSKGDLIEDSWM